MSLAVARDYYSRDAGNATFGEQANAASLAAGTYTPWFSITPRGGKPSALGVYLKFVATLTATGAATPIAGTDALDLFIQGGTAGASVEVAPAPGTATRAKTLNRQTAEFVWAVSTNTNPGVAAAPTFASASSATVTAYLWIPTGEVSAVKVKLASVITGVYASNVTISYTSVSSNIVSTQARGTFAWNEEKTASLGSGLQSIVNYTPKEIAPDAVFLQGESSSTITQCIVELLDGPVWINSTDTDVLELGAQQIAPIAGATYTTTAGFVITGGQKAFRVFQVNFASAAVHYVAYFQAAINDTVITNETAQATQAAPAVQRKGSVAPGGAVVDGSAGKQLGNAPGPGATQSGGSGRPP